MYALPAPRFFRMAWRMSVYKGVLRMRLQAQMQEAPAASPRRPAPQSTPTRRPRPDGTVEIAELMAFAPGLIERSRA